MAAFDKTLSLTEQVDRTEKQKELTEDDEAPEIRLNSDGISDREHENFSKDIAPDKNRFHLQSLQVWDEVVAAIGAAAQRR